MAILEQLGINIPPPVPPATGIGAQPTVTPMAEAQKAPDLSGIETFADTMVAGAYMLLTSALSYYGSTSEKGDAIIKAINAIKKGFPMEELKEAENNVKSLFSGAITGMMAPQTVTPAPASVPPATGVPPEGGRTT